MLSPSRPLPALHLGSWQEENSENLLLHVAGKHGPVARPMKASEACEKTLNGKSNPQTTGEEKAEEERRLGLCRLQWEDETEKVLKLWLQENPPRYTTAVGRVRGGKRGRRRGR